DVVDGTTNLAGLWRPGGVIKQAGTASLPTVELKNARLRVVKRYRDHDEVIEDLVLTLRSRHPSPGSRFYDVVWNDRRVGGASGRSQIDLQTGHIKNVRGGLPWMSIEAVLIAVNASNDSAGTWADLLGLEGMVRASDYHFSDTLDVESPRSATIELSDASLSIPINGYEESLGAMDRYLRFEQVRGTIEVAANWIRADFDALFHGARCHASATMHGGLDSVRSLDDVDFEASASIVGFEIPRTDASAPPAQTRFVTRWAALDRFFRKYDPHGPVDLEIDVRKRAGADEQLVVGRLVATARGGDASYSVLPYRVEGLTGTLECTPESFRLHQLRGEHGGGVLAIEGEVSRGSHLAESELRITGTGVPIDDTLYRALPHKYRTIGERFDPKGTLDLKLTLSRPACTRDDPAKWESRCAVSLNDVLVNYPGLPYPVEHLSGRLVVQGDRLELIGVKGSAGTARIGVDGVVTMAGSDLRDADLVLTGKDVSIDAKLLSSLPEPVRASVSPFRPHGWFDIQTALSWDNEADRLSHESDVTLHGGAITHTRFPVPITDIHGSLKVTPQGVAVREVKGKYGGSELSARGYLRLGADADAQPSVTRSTEIVAHWQGLCLDDKLRASAPAGLRRVLADLRSDTPIDVDVTWSEGPEGRDSKPVLRCVARTDGGTVTYSKLPLPFEDVHAEITWDISGVRGSGIRARYGQAVVSANFEAKVSDAGGAGTVSVIATGLALDEGIRGSLPLAALAEWDRAAVAGTADVRLDRLHYERLGPHGPRVWELEGGRIELRGVDLPGIASIEEVSGTISADGLLLDRLGGVSLSGLLKLRTVDVMGQHLHDVSASWSFARAADGRGRLALDSIQGDIYGGSMNGEVELLYDESRSRYNVSAAVHDVDIQPFVRAARSPGPPQTEPITARGFADARLNLAGLIDGQRGNRSRRGEGRVEIREGNVYRLPIMLAILNVINLSVPDQDAFHDIQADFRVRGQHIELSNLSLQGALLSLVGYGSISLPDRGVDLYLVHVPPWLAQVPGLYAAVEGASRELVELHVTGPLFRPTVTPEPLRSTLAELKSLFQRKEPKRVTATAEP
ncbi:MAG: AsmA-like C-terminal region-containing protein, partial [Phycisphaerae bacterium]